MVLGLLPYILGVYAHQIQFTLRPLLFKKGGCPRFLIEVSTCYDVMTRHGQRIKLFYVPTTWCASAYNEGYLARESRYT